MTTSHKHIRANSQNKPDADTRQRDPVCGMPAARDSLHQLRYQGIKYYFCRNYVNLIESYKE